MAHALPCQACVNNFAQVLSKFPPEQGLKGTSMQQKLQWYDSVRNEVRKHEPAIDAARWLRRNKEMVLRIVFLMIGMGFSIFVGLVALVIFK